LEPSRALARKHKPLWRRLLIWVKVTTEGVGDFTVAIEKSGGEIVSGAIEAATEVGGDLFMTIKALSMEL
jgi:hypothetical protein